MLRADATILQVAPSDEGGGAEKVAVELHLAYLERGLDAWLALGANHDRVPRSLGIRNTAARGRWARAVLGAAGLSDPAHERQLSPLLKRALRTLAEPARYARVASGLENFDSPGTYGLLGLIPSTPDILHLHNLHGSYFDIRALTTLASRAPVIVTMHDAWLLTGHCAHPFDCEHWRTGCGECPYLGTSVAIPRDRSVENARIKREALAASRVRLASPSRWLMDIAERSGVAEASAETRVIPNGVDTAVFSPGNRSVAREALGLPEDAFVVLSAARSGKTSPFKGFDTLEAALPHIAQAAEGRDVFLLALGDDAPDTQIGGVRVRFVPFVSQPAQVAEYYRAADLYLHPSRAENFPLAVLEAMACGVPVVASDVGGIPEIVVDGETGLLVPADDPQALAAATGLLLTDDTRRAALASAGASRVAALFTLDRQVQAYLDWYAEILEAGS